jgi:hypothetical protein
MSRIKSHLSRNGKRIAFIGAALLLPFTVFFAGILLYGRFLFRPLIYLLVWTFWLPRGIFVLFVHTDCYAERFDSKISPAIRGCSEVLKFPNFGPRQWRRTIAVAVYRQFIRHLHPMALVFRPFRSAEYFDFYPLWRNYRAGTPGASDALDEKEQQFCERVQRFRMHPKA